MKTPGAAGAHGLVGESPEMAGIRRLVEKASRNRLPVLLLGESGTGKEVVARAIFESARADGSCRSTAYRWYAR